MSLYRRCEGVEVEPMGDLWAAFSVRTYETTLINHETAAILELLEAGPADASRIAQVLATDSGVDAAEIVDLVQAAWRVLEHAGMIQPAARGASIP